MTATATAKTAAAINSSSRDVGNDTVETNACRSNDVDHDSSAFVRPAVYKEIIRQVIRRKLARQRHCVIEQAVSPDYLDSLFPKLLELFEPHSVDYNGGIAGIRHWKISCYLEVMPGGVPTTTPNLPLLQLFTPLLDSCNDMFRHWYRQQHACNKPNASKPETIQCHRLMTFITRYTPQPGEQSLLKVSW
jgi:hypothetical protein